LRLRISQDNMGSALQILQFENVGLSVQKSRAKQSALFVSYS
jgi:hypothetical protein